MNDDSVMVQTLKTILSELHLMFTHFTDRATANVAWPPDNLIQAKILSNVIG